MKIVYSVLSFMVIVSIVTGCSTNAASSSENEDKEVMSQQNLDEKWLHRMEQRDMTEALASAEQTLNESTSKEESSPSIRAEGQALIEKSGWKNTTLKITEKDVIEFEEQTLGYFEQDMMERYPPVQKDTIDMLATMMTRDGADLVVTGVIRNGYENKEFTQEKLENGTITLRNETMNALASSSFEPYLSKSVLQPGEALPFRHRFTNKMIRIKGFDYDAYGYYLNYTLKKEEKK
ncbi:SLAP domain-containing protein [Salibacterium halotolerans]|nr:SLAP domain-containing protein [Salibacterium halotolerans]